MAVGVGLTLMMPEVQVHTADKEQRFPLLKLEQLNDQQRPFGDEILKVSSRCFRELPASQAAGPIFPPPFVARINPARLC